MPQPCDAKSQKINARASLTAAIAHGRALHRLYPIVPVQLFMGKTIVRLKKSARKTSLPPQADFNQRNQRIIATLETTGSIKRKFGDQTQIDNNSKALSLWNNIDVLIPHDLPANVWDYVSPVPFMSGSVFRPSMGFPASNSIPNLGPAKRIKYDELTEQMQEKYANSVHVNASSIYTENNSHFYQQDHSNQLNQFMRNNASAVDSHQYESSYVNDGLNYQYPRGVYPSEYYHRKQFATGVPVVNYNNLQVIKSSKHDPIDNSSGLIADDVHTHTGADVRSSENDNYYPELSEENQEMFESNKLGPGYGDSDSFQSYYGTANFVLPSFSQQAYPGYFFNSGYFPTSQMQSSEQMQNYRLSAVQEASGFRKSVHIPEDSVEPILYQYPYYNQSLPSYQGMFWQQSEGYNSPK